jgi:hypothetical protein
MHAPVQVHALVVQLVITLLLQLHAQHVLKDAQHASVQQIAQHALLAGHCPLVVFYAHALLVMSHQQEPLAVHVLILIARYVQLQALTRVLHARVPTI